MLRRDYRRTQKLIVWLMAVAIFAMPLSTFGQTRIVAPKNKYKPSDDVQVGRQAAAEVERQMPVLRDGVIDNYVESVGRRLVVAIPQEFQHPEFRYSFDVVNARDINAFALPGGPMYVNRGMIEAARTEGEMAGVMAHEISHVALRHATAQATETQKAQIGSILGQIAGAVIGGGLGQVIGGASQVGFGAWALKYSRSYETQADILGAQIMARAGYNPLDLANMFRTIERQGGGSNGPEWLSSHPNPGNRYEAITREAQMLRVNKISQTTRVPTGFRPAAQNVTRADDGANCASRINDTLEAMVVAQETAVVIPTEASRAPSTRYRTYTEATCSASACQATGVKFPVAAMQLPLHRKADTAIKESRTEF